MPKVSEIQEEILPETKRRIRLEMVRLRLVLPSGKERRPKTKPNQVSSRQVLPTVKLLNNLGKRKGPSKLKRAEPRFCKLMGRLSLKVRLLWKELRMEHLDFMNYYC